MLQTTVRSFEDLEVYKRAYKISLDVHKVSLEFPTIEQTALADQIRRASKEICTHIAGGFGKQKYSPNDYKRSINVAIGCCDEMRVWLRYCLDLEYIEFDQWQTWRESYQELAKMLVGSTRGLEEKDSREPRGFKSPRELNRGPSRERDEGRRPFVKREER
jgi:four helix bundle protein